MKGKALTPAVLAAVRSTLELDFCDAEIVSTIWMVTMSPTSRARRSSNAGR